jgi:hypothetical protein
MELQWAIQIMLVSFSVLPPDDLTQRRKERPRNPERGKVT